MLCEKLYISNIKFGGSVTRICIYFGICIYFWLTGRAHVTYRLAKLHLFDSGELIAVAWLCSLLVWFEQV